MTSFGEAIDQKFNLNEDISISKYALVQYKIIKNAVFDFTWKMITKSGQNFVRVLTAELLWHTKSWS